jgi:hypothetical protein
MEQNSKTKEAMLKKLRLTSSADIQNARANVENELLSAQEFINNIDKSLENDDDPNLLDPNSRKKHAEAVLFGRENEDNPFKATKKYEKERQSQIQKIFFNIDRVKYGQGRLQSAHNLIGKIEEPWNVIDGKNKNLPGDRTV